MTDIFDLLDEPGGPAEKSVPVCLRGHLQADLDELRDQLQKLQTETDDSLEGDPRTGELEQQIEAVRQKMRDGYVTFRLRALPEHQYRALRDAHPPRKITDDEGKETVHPEDRGGINVRTFYRPLIQACTVSPQLSEQQWDKLFGEKIGANDFQRLGVTAIITCSQDVLDNPFTPPAASTTSRSSGGGREQPAASASRSSGSTGGNRATRRATATTKKAAS